MSIHHHLGEDMLLAYAAGSLGEAQSVLVATHLALCPHCRALVRDAEALGGHLLESIEPDASDGGALDEVMRRIELEPQEASRAQATAPAGERPVLPQPLRGYLGADLGHLAWRPLGGGAWHVPIRTGRGRVTARLIRIGAGKPIPMHTHDGSEIAMVLTGSYRDRDLQFRPGDVQEADETVEHQPVADPEEDCICLAVIDRPLRFRSWAARLLQPVTRI